MDSFDNFASSCTLPPEGTNFVSAPKVRGTLEILWSCISVLFLCTYKILHQNVLLQSTPDPHTWQKFRRTCHRILDKVGWMILNLAAPEFILAKAWSDSRSAKLAQAKIEELVAQDQVPWTTTHTHFANMGGFAISFRHLQPRSYSWASEPSIATSNGNFAQSMEIWSTLIGKIDWEVDQTNLRLVYEAHYFIEHGGSISWLQGFSTGEKERLGPTWKASWQRNLEGLQGDLWVLDAHQLRIARQLGIISRLPSISEDDLKDRDKGDVLTTVITLVQIGWFIAQLIVRRYQRNSTSQLEIMTLSFATTAAITYFLLWGRPKDLTYSITFNADRHPQSSDEIARLALWGPSTLLPQTLRDISDGANSDGDYHGNLWRPYNTTMFYLAQFYQYVSGTLGISNFAIHIDQDLETTSGHFSASAIVSGGPAMLVFGAIHFIAWNFSFPTTLERTLWRASSIILVVTPACAILVHLSPVIWPSSRISRSGLLIIGIKPLMYLGLLVCYATARCFALVEVFRSLAFLPPDVFKTGWPANLPHIS